MVCLEGILLLAIGVVRCDPPDRAPFVFVMLTVVSLVNAACGIALGLRLHYLVIPAVANLVLGVSTSLLFAFRTRGRKVQFSIGGMFCLTLVLAIYFAVLRVFSPLFEIGT